MEGRRGRERERRKKERKEAEAANLPDAFWELNLAEEISGIRSK